MVPAPSGEASVCSNDLPLLAPFGTPRTSSLSIQYSNFHGITFESTLILSDISFLFHSLCIMHRAPIQTPSYTCFPSPRPPSPLMLILGLPFHMLFPIPSLPPLPSPPTLMTLAGSGQWKRGGGGAAQQGSAEEPIFVAHGDICNGPSPCDSQGDTK